jgi:site-specific recombinase XerD
VATVRVTGPLVPFAEAYEAKMRARGYTPLTMVNELRQVAHLSYWLDEHEMTAADVTSEVIEALHDLRRTRRSSANCSLQGLLALLEVLDEQGVRRPAAPAAPAAPLDEILGSFERFLLQQRGLQASTASSYVFRVRRFLSWSAPGGEVSALRAKDITDAVLAESASVSVGATQFFVVAVRSFLRYCFIEGMTASDLSAAALSSTGRKRSALARGISQSQAKALLRSCDRRRAEGRRDFALLLVLVRLGLRSSEAASLRLDDFDWRAGEVLVRGKGGREGRLPVPCDVGDAVAAYLRRGRPGTTHREVFLRLLAPIGPLGRGGVHCIVRRACRRSGVAEVGPHRLRHALASELVRSGAPLPEVGQMLRHQGMSSLLIYVHVDIEGLRKVAQPWPGTAQ